MFDNVNVSAKYMPRETKKVAEVKSKYKFEKICDLRNHMEVFGHEILSLERHEDWLEQDIKTLSYIGWVDFAMDGAISINMSTESILNIDNSSMKLASIARPGLVIEWVEDRCRSDILTMAAQKLDFWRKEYGIRIALDDMGRGQDGLERFLAIKPDFAKIDGHLLHGARESGPHLRALSWLCKWCEDEGVPTIIEWIETEQDLAIAIACNAGYGQGYYFQGVALDQQSFNIK